LARYGFNPSASGPVYKYKTQSFDYYILGKEELQQSERTRKEFREFEIIYGIHKSPNSTLIVQENGEMILRYGPPFTFQIFFTRIDNNLETIHFNSLELIDNNHHNLLELDAIYINMECVGFGGSETYRRKEYNAEHNIIKDRDLFDEFKENKNIQIGPLVRNVKENIKNYLKNNDYINKHFSESEKNKVMNEDCRIHSIIGFRNIITHFLEDEEITIKIDFDLIMTDGEIKNFQFADTYIRQYEEGSMTNRFAPSDYQKE
jgi:hypothetical protein